MEYKFRFIPEMLNLDDFLIFCCLNKSRGYSDSHDRIPPGWRVAQQAEWPINNYKPDEDLDKDNWRFETYGSVDRPLSLTYEEFKNLPGVTKSLDHHCIDGWTFLGQVWNGIDFRVIKEETRVREEARFVLVEGSGASQRFPISQDLLFAFGQNGAPLSKAAGFPLRVVAPGEFGNRSIKWVTKLKFSAEPLPDSKVRKYTDAGIYDLYVEKIADKNPWTVEISEKKKFLRSLFAYNTKVKREKIRNRHLGEAGSQRQPRGDNSSAIEICKLSSLGENSCAKFVILGNEILLVRSNGKVRALEPMCTHQGTDLSKAMYKANSNTIRCPLHGAIFDTQDGSCLSGSYGIEGDNFPPIRTYKIRIDFDSVLLEANQEWGSIYE